MKVKIAPIFVLIAAMLFRQILVGAASGVGRAASTGSTHELRRSGSASDLVIEIWGKNKKSSEPPLSRLELQANEAFRRGDIFGGVALQTDSMIEKAKQAERQKRLREAVQRVKLDFELEDEDLESITAGYPIPLKLSSR